MIRYRTSTPAVTATTQVPTSCASSSGGPQRVRYFARQLLTADDLTQEQEYFRAKLRRHNRMLHGWGVVCGCAVTPTDKDYTVCIQPGYALSPQGDEILIDGCVVVDLSQQGLDGNAVTMMGQDGDPWCSSVRVDLRPDAIVYVAIAYNETPARPVRAQPSGCGCDSSQCEYSRIQEGFVVRVLTSLPDIYTRQLPDNETIFTCQACPECVEEPWVVLARVRIPGAQILASNIDNVQYRRNVVNFGNFWFACETQSQPSTSGVSGVGTSPGTVTATPPTGVVVGVAPGSAVVGLRRVAEGSLQGRVVRVRSAAGQPGTMELPAGQPSPAATFDPMASARATDVPIHVESVRILATRNAPDESNPVELALVTTVGQSVEVASPPDAVEVRFADAPLAFDSVDTTTFHVTTADGHILPAKVILLEHNSAWLALNSPLASGDYTITLVGAAQAGAPAIRSHQGVALEGDRQCASDFTTSLHVN